MKRSHAVGLVALAALALGLWAARGSFAPRGGPPAAEPDDDVVARAMAGVTAPVDSAEIKSRWHDEVRGVDLEGLDAAQLELLVRFANARGCTCGCGYTLAGCKASDMSCEESGARLEALRDSIRAGQLRSATGIRERPARAGG